MVIEPTSYKMCELCEITSSKRIYAADYKPEGVPFYRGKEISEKHRGNLDVSTELFIDRSKFEQIRAKFGAPKAGDLLLTSVGTLGSPYVVDDGEEFYFKDGNLTWFRNFKNLDSRFLYYWLLSPQGKAELKKCTIGSSQSAYTIVLLKEMEIHLMNLTTQRKITTILSAYDDLIENNLRRIKILEEMAQNLYREWFVKFRFPGHEQVRFIDSPLGRIPEGWALKKLGDIATVVTKGTTPTTLGKDFTDEGINFFKVESIDQTGGIEENKLAKIDFETHEILKRSKLQLGDILFSIAGAIGRTTIVPQRVLPANTNQALAIIRIQDETNRIYVFHCVRADEFQHFSLGHVVQTAQANVSLGILKSAPIVMPPNALLDQFTKTAISITQMQENLRTRNATLRRTRDMLLPRIISGEVDVSDLDITLPEEAIC
jgi:type I restriction enzyme S subunit